MGITMPQSGMGGSGGSGFLSPSRSNPHMEASSRAEGQPEKPSMGSRSCEAEREQVPWASQSHSWQSTRLSVAHRTETGSEAQLSQI